MRGRRRVYDRPVPRTITIEAWMDDLIDLLMKYKVRPSDIIKAGLISVLKTKGNLPKDLITGTIEILEPEVQDTIFVLDQLKGQLKIMESLPDNQSQASNLPRIKKLWVDDFNIVKLVGTENIFLLTSSEYQKDPTQFELLDDDTTVDCTKLPRFHAIDAVYKMYRPITTEKVNEAVSCPEK